MAKKYTNLFASIHWIHAAMITFILIGSILMLPPLPETAEGLAPFRGHMIFGFVISFVTLIRIVMIVRQPKLESLDLGTFREAIVRWNHRLIYIVLVIVSLTGMAASKMASIAQVVIYGKDPSVYTGPGGVAGTLGMMHTYSTWLLAALILMHVGGVVSYMIKSKDNILRRVGFGQG
jgi:cytochrome b561